jgi:proteasome accessory factor C
MAVFDAAARLRQLLVLLPWLAERQEVSLEEASQRFGIPEDDLVALLERVACCGLPPYTPDQLIELIVGDGMIYAQPGRHLGRPLRLSATEGFALATAGRALLSLPGADLHGALSRALDKLEAALGERDKLVVETDQPEVLAEARAATEAGERLEIEYHSATRDELTRRQVDPYACYVRDGHWYLDGYCYLAGDLRHFRLDRVRSMRRSGVAAVAGPPPAGTGVPLPGDDTLVVTLECGPEGRWVAETFPVQEVTELAEGRLRISLPVGGTAWLERLMLRLGPTATVVAPAEMVEVGPEAARRLLGKYATAN